MADSHVASPVRRHDDDDDDSPRRFKIRACSSRSSDAEANRRRCRKDDHDEHLNWDALKKSINGLVNNVNVASIKDILPELFAEKLVRGRGLFCDSCIKSQMASPEFTDVFAALVAAVNTKFPEIGRLLLVRVMLQLKGAYEQNNKPQLLAETKFIAHLVNQAVAHELLALQLVTMFLQNPTEGSVEVAVGFVRECGAMLQRFLAIRPELVLVEQRDQFTHEISLEGELDPETNLNVFRAYPNFPEDENGYENSKRSIGGSESSENENRKRSIWGSESSENAESFEEQMEEIWTNFFNRRMIHLTIMSGVRFEEAGLMKLDLKPGQEMELCSMIIECCSQEITYLRFFGLLAQRYCMMRKAYQENFEKCFVQEYSNIHHFPTHKMIIVAKFFAHLLETDTLPWHVLACIQLADKGTTSSHRIFVMILFQELSKRLGIRQLNERLNDPGLQGSLDSIFPKDHPKNMRFAMHFFTRIGLGGII
uniref:MI domain-containing protein n=1 Tax=Setaria italica TaxID=4555 RepID=K3Z0T2_SETIT